MYYATPAPPPVGDLGPEFESGLDLVLKKKTPLDHFTLEKKTNVEIIQPLVIQQERNSEGFALHGGPIQASGAFSPELQYRCGGGALWTSLLAVSVQLTDHGPGDGGFCVVRGSHKLNLPVPKAVALAKKFGAAESFKYINGVLDRLARQLRGPEVSASS